MKLFYAKKYFFYSLLVCLWLFHTSCLNHNNKKTRTKTEQSKHNDTASQHVKGIKTANTNPAFKEGENKIYYANNVLEMKGMIVNGKKEGQWDSWYPNGNLWSEGYYKKGLKNGPFTTYYKDGKKRYEANFTYGIPSGKWTFWAEDGRLAHVINYDKKR